MLGFVTLQKTSAQYGDNTYSKYYGHVLWPDGMLHVPIWPCAIPIGHSKKHD